MSMSFLSRSMRDGNGRRSCWNFALHRKPPVTKAAEDMRAAVLYGKEDVRVEDVPERPLEPGEVRVRIEAALTCGTDLKVFRRGYHARMLRPPCVFGHELAGVVSEVAPEAVSDTGRAWQVGDRVVAA